jgi:hypothetical protein
VGAFQEPAPPTEGGEDASRPLAAGARSLASAPRASALAPSAGATDMPLSGRFMDGPMSGILLGNAVTLAGAVVQHWPAHPVMLIYWGQSIAVGIANVVRMLMLREFSTDGFTSGGRQVPATPAGKRMAARFFALHYGFFHVGYGLFLLRRPHPALDSRAQLTVAINILLFAGSQLWHVIATHGNDYRGKPNLGTLMFYPYLRVIPMHLAIIFGSMLPSGALPLFILLKTGADIGLHHVERHLFRSAATGAA